jgi:hypothetical protein
MLFSPPPRPLQMRVLLFDRLYVSLYLGGIFRFTRNLAIV